MLTDTICKNATCPPDKLKLRLSDSGGLYLEVSPNGSKRWFYKYRKDGRITTFMFSTPRPPDPLENVDGGFLSHVGARTMNPCPKSAQTSAGGATHPTQMHTDMARAMLERALSALNGGQCSEVELFTALGRTYSAARNLQRACNPTTQAEEVAA